VKRLTLMRHGDAKWKDSGVPDFERPLNRRGAAEAEAMARRLLEIDLLPTLIISSPAIRARQTAEIIAREARLSPRHLRMEEALYLARSEEILKVVRATGPRVPHLMIVGHNPGISRAALELGAPDNGEEMATGGLCILEFDTRTWSTASARSLRHSRNESPPGGLLTSLWS